MTTPIKPVTSGFFVGHRGRGFVIDNDLNRRELRRLYRYLRRRMGRGEARMIVEDFLWMSMRAGTVQRIDFTDYHFTAVTELHDMTVR